MISASDYNKVLVFSFSLSGSWPHLWWEVALVERPGQVLVLGLVVI